MVCAQVPEVYISSYMYAPSPHLDLLVFTGLATCIKFDSCCVELCLRDRPDTDLILPTRRRGHLNLTDQTPRVQKVYRVALPEVFFKFCQEYAMVEATESKGWLRTALSNATQQLDDMVLYDCIRNDEDYAQQLCGVLLNRTEAWRSSMLNVAFDKVKAQYHIEDTQVSAKARQDIIRELLVYDPTRSYNYAFYFDPETRKPATNKPYMLPIFGDIMRPCFSADGGSYAKLAKDGFKTPDGACEIPAPLLALLATLVHAAIDFILSGKKCGRKTPVKSEEYYSMYTSNLNVLRKLEAQPSIRKGYH
ncbi:hypothetical protein BC835DRAFT_1419001 [Cytidiella melzeri]|nr:hypothetical protein BC835DRAFT_1419001 [Cytidiella melzeri]